MPRILTISRIQAPPLPESGCWPVANLDFMQPPQWRVRAEVAHDESLLQPIAYLTGPSITPLSGWVLVPKLLSDMVR